LGNIHQFSELDARLEAEAFNTQYAQIVQAGQYTLADLNQMLSDIDDLKSSSNVISFAASLSILNKTESQILAEIASFNMILETPKDVHYMGESDTLSVIAAQYYGDVNMLVDIQRENSVYSTDEAFLKGILRVSPRV
jgi:hypothetical protein